MSTPVTARGKMLKAEIEALWNQGLSAFRVAEKLGLTRSCVIGHVYRMRLPKRTTTEGKVCVQRKIVFHPKPVKPVIVPPPPDAPPSFNLSIEALSDRTCRQPYGTQAPYSFCGHSVQFGSPYCNYHHAINRPLGKPLLRRA